MLIRILLDVLQVWFFIELGKWRERRGYWLFRGPQWTWHCNECTVVITASDEKLLGDLAKTHELGHMASRS